MSSPMRWLISSRWTTARVSGIWSRSWPRTVWVRGCGSSEIAIDCCPTV